MTSLTADKNLAILHALEPPSKNRKIAVLVSGGVDSTLALTLLKEAGYCVEAFYLKIWLQDEFVALGDCPWEEDVAYIKPLTERLGIPLHIVPFQETYWNHIVESTVERIKLGETPNPDILCNSLVKFGAFLQYLKETYPDCHKIASGHYAQLLPTQHPSGQKILLKTSPDTLKDQTYFLARLSQEQLQHCLFPIGHLTKTEVRHYAEKYDLPSKERKDSQGLCFLGKIRFRDFIRFHLGEKTGPIIERETQKTLGHHKGFWYHTIGQRQGLNLSDGPWYVVDKDIALNHIYVSRLEELGSDEFIIRDLHWLSETPPEISSSNKFHRHYQVRIRHGGALTPCTLTRLDNLDASDSLEENCYQVRLQQFEKSIAPGQFAVFYEDITQDTIKDTICVASGIIAKSSSTTVD